MKHYIIDTNALLRFFLNDIPEQQKEVENLFKQSQKHNITILVPQIVIFELHFILDKYYGIEKNKIIELLETLISANYLQIESGNLFIGALNIYKSASISFVDSFLLSKSRAEKSGIYTFDQKLIKLQTYK